jgi:hypothetical protein
MGKMRIRQLCVGVVGTVNMIFWIYQLKQKGGWKMKRVLGLLVAMTGSVSVAYAGDHADIAVGLVDAVPIDRPAGSVNSTKPAMLGIQVDAGPKFSPYSVKYQWRTGSVGGGLKATEQNIYAVYTYSAINNVTPYVGLGYSYLSLTGNNAHGLGWIAGGDLALGKSFKAGVFYNGYQPANAPQVYNHYFGITLKYSFSE